MVNLCAHHTHANLAPLSMCMFVYLCVYVWVCLGRTSLPRALIRGQFSLGRFCSHPLISLSGHHSYPEWVCVVVCVLCARLWAHMWQKERWGLVGLGARPGSQSTQWGGLRYGISPLAGLPLWPESTKLSAGPTGHGPIYVCKATVTSDNGTQSFFTSNHVSFSTLTPSVLTSFSPQSSNLISILFIFCITQKHFDDIIFSSKYRLSCRKSI